MNVIEAITARHSTRAFMSNPVEREKLDAIFTAAARSPSWANTQPWEIYAASGNTLDKIKKEFHKKYMERAQSASEIPAPIKWPESALRNIQQLRPDMERKCGDAVSQLVSLHRNMFNAPVIVYICMDKVLSEWSLYDLGMYSQSFMLAALEQGLATIPSVDLVIFPDVLRRELRISYTLKIVIGIAVGYSDKGNAINNFISARSPLSKTVHFLLQ